MSDYETRFSGVRRLFSTKGLDRLARAHVCVVGVGGVGSWAVEALARSGIGRLTLMDLDEVCASNVNRQVHALDGEIGKAKVEVMARRACAINPQCQVQPVTEFFLESNAERLLAMSFDYVVDAIDALSKKALLISLCRTKRIPIITTGGAGGRRNPCLIHVKDLAFTSDDGLLRNLRKELRTNYGFPPEGKAPFGVECVFSSEPVVYPHSDGTVSMRQEEGTELRLNCENGYGTASFVTGTFGFAAAARVVAKLAGG